MVYENVERFDISYKRIMSFITFDFIEIIRQARQFNLHPKKLEGNGESFHYLRNFQKSKISLSFC